MLEFDTQHVTMYLRATMHCYMEFFVEACARGTYLRLYLFDLYVEQAVIFKNKFNEINIFDHSESPGE